MTTSVSSPTSETVAVSSCWPRSTSRVRGSPPRAERLHHGRPGGADGQAGHRPAGGVRRLQPALAVEQQGGADDGVDQLEPPGPLTSQRLAAAVVGVGQRLAGVTQRRPPATAGDRGRRGRCADAPGGEPRRDPAGAGREDGRDDQTRHHRGDGGEDRRGGGRHASAKR
jgi:hypothetical protein